MLTATLLLLCASAPVGLAGGAPRTLHLVEEQQAESGYDGWSHAALQEEYFRLAFRRPGLFLPVGLLGGGTMLLTAGAIGLLSTGLAASGTASIVLYVFFGVACSGGLALLIAGAVILFQVIPQRAAIGAQMDEVERRLQRDDEDPPPRQRGREAPVPPMQTWAPRANLTLARF